MCVRVCFMSVCVLWAGGGFIVEDSCFESFGRESRQVSETAKGQHVTACLCVKGQEY